MGCFGKKTKKVQSLCFYDSFNVKNSNFLLFRPIKLKHFDIQKEYSILEVLGSGSFGEVKKVKHLTTE